MYWYGAGGCNERDEGHFRGLFKMGVSERMNWEEESRSGEDEPIG